jgi:hypothetical protein
LSEPAPIGAIASARPEVRAAIARAANATGVDFSYLLGQARLESSLDPAAKAATSSAAGLYQFTSATWLATVGKHGAEHGLVAPGDMVTRRQLLALRYDPQAAALMAAELAGDNRDALAGVLGREPDAAELYMAHFLGAQGAAKFLSALAADPSQSAAALFPAAAGANRAVFFERSGAPRSLGGVMGENSAFVPPSPAGVSGWTAPGSPSPVRGTGRPETGWGWGNHAGVEPPSQPFPTGEGPSGAPPTRPSMAATLAATFGAASEAMPAHVRSAYGKLKAFGL